MESAPRPPDVSGGVSESASPGGPRLALRPPVPRLPRFLLVEPGSINHCCWQAHNHERLFELDGAREKFLELLARHKAHYGILIHSYCLMGTHPHVLCTATQGQQRFSAFWKVVNHGFACWLNRKLGRRGQVVMDRLGSPRIEPAPLHVLRVMRYGDRNPVRAGLCRRPKDWKWSSHRHYAFGSPDPIVDDPPAYLGLGRSPAQRRKAYQQLACRSLEETLHHRHDDFLRPPFVGSPAWVADRCAAAGLDPPG